jgi:amino-acid N-acetyltransferase
VTTAPITPLVRDPEADALLEACELPTSDLGNPAIRLYGCRRGGRVAGVVGLERYGEIALLRSLAVAESERRSGLGRALVEHAEHEAAAQGVQHLYLLTSTAEAFFAGLGYVRLERSAAPPAIAATTQFSVLCPACSAFMSKSLESACLDGTTRVSLRGA